MTNTNATACAHCAGPFTKTPDGLGTGYAKRASDGALICYTCADFEERCSLLTQAKFCAYVSSDGKSLTTWTGGILGRVTGTGKPHPWTRRSPFGERRYMTFRDVHGQGWHGTGAPGMYATIRRTATGAR
jgi:hypothetical protein